MGDDIRWPGPRIGPYCPSGRYSNLFLVPIMDALASDGFGADCLFAWNGVGDEHRLLEIPFGGRPALELAQRRS